MSIISLPNPLILLIHLHILEYPHANNPEYDHNIFNPRIRGLRERVKLMEDISHFLVGRIEGGKIGARTVLPTYPCIQPSETVAFRTSLAKYLDYLRHPTSGTKSSNTQVQGKGSDMAWWWKDVIVRRSLLEEFERVLLALSTHALMKKSSTPIAWDATTSVFRSQPFTYANKLANYQLKRHTWSRRASFLTRRQEDLTKLQKLALLSTPSSRYASFSIQQLQAISESKMQDLLEGGWAGKEGRDALGLFIELVGLKSSTDGPEPLQEAVKDAPIVRPLSLCKQPSPLPVAAAHHPSHLKKFRRAIFQTKHAQTTEPPSRSHAEIKLSDSLESEKRTRQTLVDSLSRTQNHRVELLKKLKALKSSIPSPTTHTLDSWTFPSELVLGSFDWDPKPTREMFASLSLPVPHEDEELALETRIQRIREDLLTPHPPIPDPSAPRLLPLETKTAKIQSLLPRPATAESISHVVTLSTPARSIKRKSIRFSMAQKGRPSLFRIGGMQDAIDRLVDATEDHSDPESDSELSFATPKVKAKINRIWTSGTPKSTLKNTPRESFPMIRLLSEPSLSLPSLLSTELLGPEETDSLEQDVDFTPMARRRDGGQSGTVNHPSEDADLYEKPGDEDISDDDPPSMTLREILLDADASHFHLLGLSIFLAPLLPDKF
ncbi:hypothetical protein BYT27DRAFT_7118735 [Phlegmacium glaucopus]|nr:hypothetical protein BYT27DRAFT_7118735 [Phlegmacium glaucopus]